MAVKPQTLFPTKVSRAIGRNLRRVFGENESLSDVGDPSGVRVGEFGDVLVGKPGGGGVLFKRKRGGCVPVIKRVGSWELWVVW